MNVGRESVGVNVEVAEGYNQVRKMSFYGDGVLASESLKGISVQKKTGASNTGSVGYDASSGGG